MRRQSASILSITLAVLLIGCAQDRVPVTEVSPSIALPTVTPTTPDTPTPVPTIPTETPTSIPVTPTQIVELNMDSSLPTPALPFFSDTDFFMDEMVFGSESSDCRLPCWQGILVGESTIQQVLDGSIGIPLFIDRSYNQGGQTVLAIQGIDREFPGASTISNSWFQYEGDETIGGAYLVIGYRENTGIVTFINLSTDTQLTDTAAHLNPAQVMEELGSPQIMLAGIQIMGSARDGRAELWLIYDNGSWFGFYDEPIHIDPLPVGPSEHPEGIAHFCFDNNIYAFRDFLLFPPDSKSDDVIVDMQQAVIEHHTERMGLVSADTLLGMSLDDITATVLRQGTFCFEVRIET